MGHLVQYARRAHEAFHEHRLGIVTAEYHESIDSLRPDFRGYSPTSYRDWAVIRRLIRPEGSFIDYGAGLGRVTILAAREPFQRVIGVDLDQELVSRGNENIRRAHGLRCPANIICSDAALFDVPDDATVLYFYNPFCGDVLEDVLANVEVSISRRRRPIQLICNLPHESAFEEEIFRVEWISLQKRRRLWDQRKLLIFDSRY